MSTLTFVVSVLALALLAYLLAYVLFKRGRSPIGCPNSGCFFVPAKNFIYITEDDILIDCKKDPCRGWHQKERLKVINHTHQDGFVIGYKSGFQASPNKRLASLNGRIEEFDCSNCTYEDTRRFRKVTLYRSCDEWPCP